MNHLLLAAACMLAFGQVAYGQAVNGNWGDWQTWSSCSVTCLQGTRSRSRNCDNPAASGGGAACSGDDTETANCLIMNYCIPSYLGNTDLNCSSSSTFGCATGVVSCIDITKQCDGNYDCEDGSDENPYFTNCTTKLCLGSGVNDIQSTLMTGMVMLVILFVTSHFV
ncbi:coadhesin-like [Ruditapes philippinarum]|uniref:coadhesin-like n=1 Tax=Ruditapes philippinarum TaxID=129788 RepID=UPI00295B8299|nr:coadhesin-like [Ruditapes philippinarum]